MWARARRGLGGDGSAVLEVQRAGAELRGAENKTVLRNRDGDLSMAEALSESETRCNVSVRDTSQ